MVQLSVSGLSVPGYQRARHERFAEGVQEARAVVWSGMRTPTVRLRSCSITLGPRRGLQDERVGPGRRGLDRAEDVVVHLDVLAELGELATHQRSGGGGRVDRSADAIQSVAVAQHAPQRERRTR